MENLKIEYLPVGSLKPYEKNAKKHPAEQVEHIANSIREFGFRQPLVIDKDNVLVIGHGRLLAAKKLGLDTVPCVRADDLTDEQIKALRLADNKTNESEWDFDLLGGELDDIFDIDMSEFGFELENEEEPAEIVEDEVPEDVETRCKAGDIWQLGNHRLMCGDSTSEADVRRLMNGQTAKMLFTSPPYSDMREYNGDKDLSVNNLVKFIPTYRPYTDYQCVNLGIQRANNEIVPYWDGYIEAAHECGYKLLAWNVWDKLDCGSIGQHRAFIPLRHEFIFVFGVDTFEINATWEKQIASITDKKARKVRQRDGSMKESSYGDGTKRLKKMESVLQLRGERGTIRSEHPAVFPVDFPCEYILAMSDANDNVIEPFGGSGTTLIACEQTNRKCYMMELDPHYCDVIIQRWENLTGETAVLLNG